MTRARPGTGGPAGRLLRALRRWGREEAGAVTAEFVVVLPLLLMLMFPAIDAGVQATRATLLERALELTVRDIRLGRFQNPTHDAIRAALCTRMRLLAGCEQRLLLELRPVNPVNYAAPTGPAPCINRAAEVQPVTTFNPGVEHEVMLIRACAIVEPVLPTTPWALGMPRDGQGGYQISAVSAFVNEPR